MPALTPLLPQEPGLFRIVLVTNTLDYFWRTIAFQNGPASSRLSFGMKGAYNYVGEYF